MSIIYIARHGQDEDNANGILNGHRDTPLTEIGLAQAVSLAKAIGRHELKINFILSSPLLRARQTAQTVANTLQLPEPTVVPELIERDFGVMTGQPVTAIDKLKADNLIKTPKVTYFLTAAKSETFSQLERRATKLLAHIQTKYKNQNVLLVTHGDLSKMLYGSFYHLPWREVLQHFYLGNADLLQLAAHLDPTHALLIKTNQHEDAHQTRQIDAQPSPRAKSSHV